MKECNIMLSGVIEGTRKGSPEKKESFCALRRRVRV